MVYYGSDNNVYELTKQLGAGAEGVVYNIKGHNNIVAKILKASDPQVLLKVRLMSHMDWPEFIADHVTFPLAALYDNENLEGECKGFIMKKLICKDVLLDVYNKPENRISIYNQACIAENLCELVDQIHKRGYVNDHYSLIIGDFNPKNIFVDRKTGNIQLTDADSFHCRVNYRGRTMLLKCKVLYKDLFFIPELKRACIEQNVKLGDVQGETFTIYTDYFCLAYHVHRLLLGVSPYGNFQRINNIDDKKSAYASIPSPPSDVSTAMAGNYVYTNITRGYKVPDRYPDFNILTPRLQQLFKRAFQDGASDPTCRPTAAEFAEALREFISQLRYCECGCWDHYLIDSYNKDYCEWCRVEHESNEERVFHKENIPDMTNMELMHCLDLELKDSYKAEICFELGKRSVGFDEKATEYYFNNALTLYSSDTSVEAIKRKAQIQKEITKIKRSR